eukprot:906226-Amphidinium_carterae.1
MAGLYSAAQLSDDVEARPPTRRRVLGVRHLFKCSAGQHLIRCPWKIVTSGREGGLSTTAFR